MRALLADEVGLGKTIEAGLIMQTLQSANPNLRAVVVAPGALLGQWLLELHVRFGGRTALMLDGERLATYKGDPWENNLIIISAQALENLDRKHALRFTAAKWDVAIVDECHRMKPGGRLYNQVQVLSKRSRHVMLLSATPDRRHGEAYAGLLGLLRPGSAPDAESVEHLLAEQDKLEQLCERTLEYGEKTADISWETLLPEWQAILGSDPAAVELFASAAAGDVAPLLTHAADTHRLDNDVIRHRRRELAELAERSGVAGLELATRVAQHVTYTPDEPETHIAQVMAEYCRELCAAHDDPPPRLLHWLSLIIQASWTHPDVLVDLLSQRMAEIDRIPKPVREVSELPVLLRGDGSPGEQAESVRASAIAYVDAAREENLLDEMLAAAQARADGSIPARSLALADALQKFWDENPREKVLVFVQSSDAVHGVAADLADTLGMNILTFGAHQEQEEREQAVSRFRDDDRTPVLVSDALGGEGRNFQFVSLLVHYDLPWSPAVVEQRVGRIDRIGRDGEVISLVMQAEGGCDAAWAEVLDQAVGVFRRSSAGLEFVLDDIAEKVVRHVAQEWSAGLRGAMDECSAIIEAERAAEDERSARRLAHEADAFAAATALAEKASKMDMPIHALIDWTRGMGGRLRRDHDDERRWHLRLPRDQVPSTGVFQREAALVRPELSFYAPGQHQIDEVIADAMSARWCDAGAWRRAASDEVKQWEGLRVACALVPDWAALAAAGVSLDAWRLLADCWDERRHICWVRLSDHQLEDSDTVIDYLRQPFGKIEGDSALSVDSSRGFWLKPLKSREHFPQLLQWQKNVLAGREVVEGWAQEKPPQPCRRYANSPPHAWKTSNAKPTTAPVQRPIASAPKQRIVSASAKKPTNSAPKLPDY